jgi:sugar phosphate isomerase/epimerase
VKLGISSYAYRWALGGDLRFGDDFELTEPLDVFGLIDKVSSLGLEVLQICENVDFDMADEDYRRLAEVAKSKGITLELGDAGIDASIFDRNVRISDLMDSHLLRLYPEKREPIGTLIKKIRGFLPVLRDQELTLAIENSSLCLYSSNQLAEVFERIDDPLVGACVDVVNSTGLLETPLETVRVLSPYAVSLHLKDFSIKRRNVGGFTIFGVPLGKGMVDVKAVINAIEKSGRQPNVLLEQWMDKRDNEEETLKEEQRWMKESVRFLRSVI